MKRDVAILFVLLLTSTVPVLQAQEQRHSASANSHFTDSHRGANGGTLQSVGTLRIETVLRENGILFMVRGADGQTLKAREATGSLTLRIEDKPKEYALKLQPLKNGGVGAAIDLTRLKGKILHMDVVLNGLGDQSIKFHSMATLSDTVSDAVLISLQKTCPVTGKSLGSMGKPPKIIVEGKPLFVCCEPCSAKIKAKPDEYLAKYYAAKGKEIRPGVFEATLADAGPIAAQKKCPVMDEALGGMGAPQKVNVNGKSVYICCAGCAKKLIADPDKYLAVLARQGVKPPKFK
ncbi:MAG: hypothetical protein AAGG48_10910 [Planctomycetota bacterium]